jgi:hypothetical protein
VKKTAKKDLNTTHMYAAAKTWNPFKGCEYNCAYCVPSFQRQAKRQMHNCKKCYDYVPHEHPDKLAAIPSAEIVFVCGNSDLSFCTPAYIRRIIEAIRNRRNKKPQTFYLQSKKPSCLAPFLKTLPSNIVLVTTLETNRDKGYGLVSKAPKPSVRYKQFLALRYPRKVITAEPVMDFDVQEFADRIIRIRPEYVWLGYNSRDKEVQLPEPSPEKLQALVAILLKEGIKIRGKHLRGIKLPGVERTQG